jgi:hypothetical protein
VGKRKGSEIFSDMTTGEMNVLTAKLRAGSASEWHVNRNGAAHTETHEVLNDIHEAYKEKWNAEHPNHQID